MPAFLARVPRNLPLDSPLPAACAIGMPLLEAIEQRATAEGIPVDARESAGDAPTAMRSSACSTRSTSTA